MSLVTNTIVDCAQVYRDAVDYFPAHGNTTASIVFGWREPTKQTNQGTGRASRVVFTPGDDKGKSGLYTGPRMNTNPRQIATRMEIFTIRVWGFDPTNPNDEAAQYQATRDLEAMTLNSLRASACGNYTIKDSSWIVPVIERAFGRELMLTVELAVPVLRTADQTAANPDPPANAPEYTVSLGFITGDVQGCPHDS